MLQRPEYVVTRPYKVGSIEIERGDRYDKAAHGFGDATERAMIFTRQLVPLTREAFLTMNQWRAEGEIGPGWSLEMLVEHEVLTEDEAEAIRRKRLQGEEYRGLWIVPIRQGNFTRFEVRGEQGEVLREKRFNKTDNARAWIDARLDGTDAATDDDGAEESQHGVHVQSGSQPAAG